MEVKIDTVRELWRQRGSLRIERIDMRMQSAGLGDFGATGAGVAAIYAGLAVGIDIHLDYGAAQQIINDLTRACAEMENEDETLRDAPRPEAER